MAPNPDTTARPDDSRWVQSTPFIARAFNIAERIDVRPLSAENRYPGHPLVLSLGLGVAVVFRYGAVVFLGVTEDEERAFLERLVPHVHDPQAHPETEHLTIHVVQDLRERAEAGHVAIADATPQRLLIIADVLGKTVVLAQYEAMLARHFDLIEPMARGLVQRGRAGRDYRALVRHIGSALLAQQKLVGRVEVVDKPEVLWDQPELEPLYVRLEDEFEIRERHAMLERKLGLVSETVQTLLDLIQVRRSLRVEWYIVLLIVFDILFGMYEKFVMH